MNLKLILSSFLMLLICQNNSFAQGFLSTDGQAIVTENGDSIILRGMGLGGWMLQEGYMLQTADFANAQYQIRSEIEQLIGESNTDLFYAKWLENHVQKTDIDSLKAWGFNSVRLPMHYNLFTLPIEEEPIIGGMTWLDIGFELTDSLISWCKQNEMYVILDLHAAPGGQGQDQGISDYDPNKPSLWQSQRNRDKTVALWQRLAERYVDEPWVAGYDLLNEVNWNLPGGTALRNLYEDITDAIRSVDNNHIIFIEGNWFANDFTGLTPPWDDKLVYSPHKYWSENFQKDIQWVLTLTDQFNVPLYFGESGENSNTWFRDAIELMEDHNIGWAWWPMKKVESIAGPLSVTKKEEYQTLLDYWNGGGNTPTEQFAFNALMDLTEQLKIENCTYQKDVIDAMFRQVQSDESIPFKNHSIPGIIYASDFDMGINGSAYFDNDVANYHITTGNFTAWNNGWAYRNDGVDIQQSDDNINSNGYNVGWINSGEWMKYTVTVETDALYEAKVRIAANSIDGKFYFKSGDAQISEITATPNTGGWENWATISISDIALTTADEELIFYTQNEGFNIGSFELIETAPLNSVLTEFLSAYTIDKNTIKLVLNKPLNGPVSGQINDFEITVNGGSVSIESIELNNFNNRIISLNVDHEFTSDEIIKISYSGDEIIAVDDTPLNIFTLEDVENNIPNLHHIPGKIEAEDYSNSIGIVLESTSDIGGGENVGFLDVGDYMDYLVNVAAGGIYKADFRYASDGGNGQIKLQLINGDGSTTEIKTVGFNSTGGWQNWATISTEVTLPAGTHQLRVLISQPLFNLNWYEFNLLTPTNQLEPEFILNAFPNPTTNQLFVHADLLAKQNIKLSLRNQLGQSIFYKQISRTKNINEEIDLTQFTPGLYYLTIVFENGEQHTRKITKK